LARYNILPRQLQRKISFKTAFIVKQPAPGYKEGDRKNVDSGFLNRNKQQKGRLSHFLVRLKCLSEY
jgi:hypothetical protein